MDKWKLVVFDIDGTLARKKHIISRATIDAISKVSNKGIQVVLASGRSVSNLNKIFNQLKLNQKEILGIAYNGALIYDYSNNNQVLLENSFNSDQLRIIFELSNDCGLFIWGYSADQVGVGYTGNKWNWYYLLIQHYSHCRRQVWKPTPNSRVYKIILGGNRELMTQVQARILQALDCNIFDISFFGSKNSSFVEITIKAATKSNGVRFICNKWKINQHQVMAFGNGSNDIDMLVWSGIGVAMGNASNEVKKHANIVTLSNKEDGVAQALYSQILQNNA